MTSDAEPSKLNNSIARRREVHSYEEWLTGKHHVSNVPEEVLRRAYSMYAQTDPKELDKGASDEEVLVRIAVANNRATTPDVLARLAADNDDCIFELANNPSTPVEILSRISHDCEEMIRADVASNPALPVADIERLASDDDDCVRSGVAMNPATPSSTIDALARDSHGTIRKAVAACTTKVDLLGRLAMDEDYSVRLAVAENPNTSPAVLENLAADPAHCVRESVLKHPNSTDHIRTIAVLAGGAGREV